MAASIIENVLVEYDYTGGQPQSKQVNGAYSVQFNYMNNDFTILSDNVASSSDIEGFLYVPSFTINSTCYNATASYITPNVTQLVNLPNTNDFPAIALGPWTSPSCVFAYLNLIAQTNNVRAFYTWLPNSLRDSHDQSYAQGAPPNASDQAWDLGDNGNWKSKYGFPVYAINSGDASSLMSLLSNYSGNISTVTNGPQLAQQFAYATKPSVKMYSIAQVATATTLPSLWVFLLIVLGILIAVLVIASIAMRIIQGRRRRELQRLIANGEINLESIGVARIKVTEEILNKMPIYIYVEHKGTPGPAHAPPAEMPAEGEVPAVAKTSRMTIRNLMGRSQSSADSPATGTASQLPSIIAEKDVLFPQDTCPICIDDYENHVTPVRWLACSHIFHPACIDPLLREYSSLCPICKASVLPKDYVPEVTNIMVRRERLNRRFREIERREREREQAQPNMPVHFSGLGRFVRVNNQDNGANAQTHPGQAPQINVEDVEMQRMQPAAETPVSRLAVERSASAVSVNSTARRPENVTREEWARQRAATLVGTSETVEEAEQREEARKPIWRRVLGPLFPNLR